MISHHAQDRRAALQGENDPKVPADAKLEVISLQSPNAQTAVQMRLTERGWQLTKRFLQSIKLIVGQQTRLVPKAPGVFNS